MSLLRFDWFDLWIKAQPGEHQEDVRDLDYLEEMCSNKVSGTVWVPSLGLLCRTEMPSGHLGMIFKRTKCVWTAVDTPLSSQESSANRLFCTSQVLTTSSNRHPSYRSFVE